MNDFTFEFAQGKDKWNEGRWGSKGIFGQYIEDNKLLYIEGNIYHSFLDENGYDCSVCTYLSINLKIKNKSRHKLTIEFEHQIFINDNAITIVKTLIIDDLLAADGEKSWYMGKVKLSDLKDTDTIKLKITNIKITQRGKNYITTFFIPENSDDSSSED